MVLFVNEREILAHKAVLAAVSPALFDMFKDEGVGEEQTDLTPRAAGYGTPLLSLFLSVSLFFANLYHSMTFEMDSPRMSRSIDHWPIRMIE